ncbi:MAG: hypothetical protein V3U94_04090 [Candidatus Thorarchaeota archaeon]
MSLDAVVDLSRTREIKKGGVALTVNVDTLLFLTSSPGEVHKASEICIQQAAVSGAYIFIS